MQRFALSFLLLLHILPTTITADDLILINCGASANLRDSSGRTWEGDGPSPASAISSSSTAPNIHPPVPRVPYETASFVHSPFTYTFHLQTAGPKFLRLYFYPAIYLGFNTSLSTFSVAANAFNLLTNFTTSSPSQPSLMKEFLISIDQNQTLDLAFFPNPKSFAFINGIEIVSVPDKLYLPEKDLSIDENTVFENIYRLNVGGSKVEIQDDSGMFRAWFPDDYYIHGAEFGLKAHAQNPQVNYTNRTPPYSAPAVVYTTSRMSNYGNGLEWRLPVDSGNYYMIRFHFCEIQTDVTEQNQRVFTISINNKTAENKADVVLWSGGNGIPIFRDYITQVPDGGNQELLLSLTPNDEGNPRYNITLLNGLEIFKLKNFNTSVIYDHPLRPAGKKEKKKRKKNPLILMYVAVGRVISLFLAVAAVSFLIFRKQRAKASATKTAAKSLWDLLSPATKSKDRTSGLCRCFSLDEIKTATQNFDESCVIGKGGFGNVYSGLTDDGATTVAIKRLNPSSNQGAHEFLTEIQMLSKLRHLHLVSLIGYCYEKGEMILVYDYMARGTLRDYLCNSEESPMTWKQHLRICLGAAKGLDYLHTGTKQAIIHRDVKTTNILLDEKWVAKISDFGLSKTGPANDSFTHISTNVKGTFGYLDPEYFSTSKLTRKSDVYAFGVVLFEVLCRRGAVDMRLEEEQHSLAGWARHCIQEGKVDQMIDHSLKGQISAACLEAFVGIGGRCLHIRPHERPAMADVVKGLELAMALQETTYYSTQQIIDL